MYKRIYEYVGRHLYIYIYIHKYKFKDQMCVNIEQRVDFVNTL
jgi:hypothetical protein